eukprot:357480-Chlamydomonas_euryale.AAC.1
MCVQVLPSSQPHTSTPRVSTRGGARAPVAVRQPMGVQVLPPSNPTLPHPTFPHREEHAPLTLCVSPWASVSASGAWAVPRAPGRLPAAASGLQLLLSNVAPWLARTSSGSAGAAATGKLLPARSRPAPLVALGVGGALSVYVVAVLIGYAGLRRGL